MSYFIRDMGAGASISSVLKPADAELWSRVVQLGQHERMRDIYIHLNRSGKFKETCYETVKKEVITEWAKGYPETVAKVLERWGYAKVTKMEIHRSIPRKTLMKLRADTVDIKKRVEGSGLPRDKFFTTSLWLQLNGRLWILVEKKNSIFMETMPRRLSCEQSIPVSFDPKIHSLMTLKSFMANARSHSSSPILFFGYHQESNDSERFVINALEANRISGPELDTFLRQSTVKVLRTLLYSNPSVLVGRREDDTKYTPLPHRVAEDTIEYVLDKVTSIIFDQVLIQTQTKQTLLIVSVLLCFHMVSSPTLRASIY